MLFTFVRAVYFLSEAVWFVTEISVIAKELNSFSKTPAGKMPIFNIGSSAL